MILTLLELYHIIHIKYHHIFIYMLYNFIKISYVQFFVPTPQIL